MVILGTVTGQEIRKNRDGDVEVRLLKVRISNDVDVRTVQYMPMSGDDSPPQTGDKVVVMDIGPAFQVALGVQDSVVPSAAAGERKMYSRNGAGAVAAFILMNNAGDIEIDGTGPIKITSGGVVGIDGTTIELNGNAKTAVSFAPLDTQLQALVGAINLLFTSKLDGGGTAGTLSLDLSTANVPTVKVP